MPLVLAIAFVAMLVMGIDFHRISLGALIIALGLLVDDAIIALETMVVEDGAGLRPPEGGGRRLGHHGLPDADRNAGDGRGLPAHRLRAIGVGEYTGSIFWVVATALVAS